MSSELPDASPILEADEVKDDLSSLKPTEPINEPEAHINSTRSTPDLDDLTLADQDTADDGSPVEPLQIQIFDHSDIAKPRSGLLFPVYRRVQQAIQMMVPQRTPEEVVDLVDEILLIESRLHQAKTRTDQQQAMAVLEPVKTVLADEFSALGFPELQKNIDRLLLMLGPMLSRMPIQVGDKIYALLWFKEYNNATVKIVMDHNASPGAVIDGVIGETLRNSGSISAIPAETIISAIAKTLGKGPPYTVLNITAPVDVQDSDTPLFVGDMSTISTGDQETAFQEFLKRARDAEKKTQPCRECWQTREYIAEEIISILKQESQKIGVLNYDTENEILLQRVSI